MSDTDEIFPVAKGKLSKILGNSGPTCGIVMFIFGEIVLGQSTDVQFIYICLPLFKL